MPHCSWAMVVALLAVAVGTPLRVDRLQQRQRYHGHHGLLPVSHLHQHQQHAVEQPAKEGNDEDIDGRDPARYSLGYSVQDEETGDLKSQHETRQGDVVSGRYSLREPGGGLRVVTYQADGAGFRAVVRNQEEQSAAASRPAARRL